eukprot:GHVN01009299.1.p1 GENE.GHVN01009299.1~~GHVN01009299.1.p1  ORF type:complete len:420 (+),score=109.06 GHVN01009299.1:177-1436(+)
MGRHTCNLLFLLISIFLTIHLIHPAHCQDAQAEQPVAGGETNLADEATDDAERDATRSEQKTTLDVDVDYEESEEGEIEEDDADELDIRCADYEFPSESFVSQTDPDKVYLVVGEVQDGPFKEQELTKFASVFGVRIIAHKDVEDDKVLHVANLVAQLLDNNGDGVVDSKAMQTQLLERYSAMFIVSDQGFTNYLLSSEDDKGFPVELKYCPYSFDYEENTKIQPGGEVETICPQDLFNKDRSVAFASDHLIGRGWPKILIDDEDDMETDPKFKAFTQYYNQAITDQTFDLDKTGCPEDDQEYCGMVMFASWAVTTYLGVDKCWCHSVGAWLLCDAEDANEKYPDLMKFIQDEMVKVIPDGKYSPTNDSVIKRVNEEVPPITQSKANAAADSEVSEVSDTASHEAENEGEEEDMGDDEL